MLLLAAGPAMPQGNMAEYNAKLRAVNAMSPRDWYELGLWCKTRMMWLHARSAFKKSMAFGGAYKAKCCYEMATIAHAQNDSDEAIEWLEKALEADPGYERAKKFYSRLSGQLGRAKSEGLGTVTEAYKGKRYTDTVKAIVEFAGRSGKDRMSRLGGDLSEALGEDVFKVLVKCRLKGKCSKCSGGGFSRCTSCLGRGYRKYTRVTRTRGGRKLVQEERQTYFRQCSKCKGGAAIECRTCKGTGLYLDSVYDGEKSALAVGLADKAADSLKTKKGKRRSKKKKDDPIADYREAVNRSKMYEVALKLDKEAVAEAQEDLEKNLDKTADKLEDATEDYREAVDEHLTEYAKKNKGKYIKKKKKDDKDDDDK